MHTLTPVPESPRAVMVGLPHDDIVARIPADVDAIGVSCMFSVNWVANRVLLRRIRRRFPRTPLIIGGEHATALAEYCLRDMPAIDYVVLGEGEASAAELLRTLKAGGDVGAVRGIAFLRDGTYHATPARPRQRDVDQVPWPAWDLVPMENYLRDVGAHCLDNGRAMPILTSRGCPYACTFCSNPMMWGRLWRPRDPRDIVAEIEHYCRVYQVEHVDFLDMTTIVNRRWIIDLCTLLIERDLKISWQLTTTRSEAIDDEVCRLLRASRCTYVTYAPESGSAERLAAIKKGVDPEKMLVSMAGALRSGLGVKVTFMQGFPDDRWRDVLATYGLSLRVAWMGAHDASFFPFQAYPGSELFRDLVAAGEIQVDERYFQTLLIFEYGFMTSWSRRFGSRQLRLICLFGYGLFYFASFVLRPWRFLRLLRDLRRGQGSTKFSAGLLRLRRQRRDITGAPALP